MNLAPDFILVDGGQDGGVDERCWVPVAHASTPEAAIAWAYRMLDYEAERLREDDMELICDGQRSWHCQSPCMTCDGTGADEYTLPGDRLGPHPACEVCNGTGEQSEDSDWFSWERCKPDTPGAIEFWDLEVADVPAERGMAAS